MKHALRHLCLLTAAVLLSGCALFSSADNRGMPSRDSIIPGEEITVSAGENIYAIARKYNVPMREIIVLNDLKSPYALKKGQSLTLPAGKGDLRTPKAVPMSSVEAVQLEPLSGKPVSVAPLTGPTPPSNAPVSLLPEPVKPQPLETTVAKAKVKVEETKSDVTGFIAIPPVQGPIISGFGAKGAGTTNDGINIGAPKGSPVVAASGGIVVYAGNEMKGFGNLVLVRHEGGWVTAYAHLERMMVTKDAVVAAGDQIGTVGTSGGVATPQLHFETRLDGKPVNPQTVIQSTD